MEESDILIVGSGVFGLSTAVHLVKDNKSSDRPPLKVTLLDPQPYDPPPTKGGASDDINKIVRADYEDAFYMELAYETLDAWSSDPEFVAAEVFHRTGWVVFSAKNPPPATTPAVERAPNRKLGASVVQRIRENLRNGSRPDCTADLSLDDVKRKWGGVLAQVDLDVFEPAYSNPNVGWVDVPRAKRIMVDKALKGGVKYEVEEVVELLHGNDEVNG
jgi:sarcosine oxidase/L-pipecolate oxidase